MSNDSPFAILDRLSPEQLARINPRIAGIADAHSCPLAQALQTRVVEGEHVAFALSDLYDESHDDDLPSEEWDAIRSEAQALIWLWDGVQTSSFQPVFSDDERRQMLTAELARRGYVR